MRDGKRGKTRSPRAASAGRPGRGFSFGSFVAGVPVGAIAAAGGLFALQMGDAEGPAAEAPPPVADPKQAEYWFWEVLPSERLGPPPPAPTPPAGAPEAGEVASAAPGDVVAQTPPAAPPPAPLPTATEYLLQAGAFREAGAAEQRRAELLLAGMAAQTKSIGVEDGVLYRVLVGPFPSMAEARRVTAVLREREITPVLLERAVRQG